jgi:hypothetical protein
MYKEGSMKRLFFAIGFLCVVATAAMIWQLRQGIVVEPTHVLNSTYFEDAKTLGRVLARRFYVDLKSTTVVVFGVSSHVAGGRVIWQEFLRTAGAEGWIGAEVLDFPSKVTVETVVTHFQNGMKSNRRLALFIPATEEMWQGLEAVAPSGKTLLFFQVPFQLLKDDLGLSILPCERSKPEPQFGCMAQDATLAYQRKKLRERRFAAKMEKMSDLLYLLFVYEPAAI